MIRPGEVAIVHAHAVATAKRKPKGYVESLISAGRVDGGLILIPTNAYRKLRWRYGGVGDRITLLIAPFIRGTRFANCQSCKRRTSLLNRIFSSKKV